MLSNNEELNDIISHPLNLPSDFHVPTNYKALCQLLEHNHQHHFKSINEMCYGCDKLENIKNVQENEDLNEKIEHIQPQNHEHLCSLHALQFYPCLEDNMEIIGELNTYAKLEDSTGNSSTEKKSNDIKTEIKKGNDIPLNTTTKPVLVNDLIQQNITINNINQNNNNNTILIKNENNESEKKNNLTTKETPSMYIPATYPPYDNLIIPDNQYNNKKDDVNTSEQLLDNLIKAQSNNVKSVYNPLNNVPPILNGQEINQQINSKPLTYTEPLTSMNAINKMSADNIKGVYNMLNNLTTKVDNNNLNMNGYPSLSIMDNEKIATNLPNIYTKSHSLPIYAERNLMNSSTPSSSSSLLNKNNNLTSLTTTEINNTMIPSTNNNNPITTALLNQSLVNINTNSTPSNLTYTSPTSSLNISTSSTSNIDLSVIPPIQSNLSSISNPAIPTTSNLSNFNNSSFSSTNPTAILPKTEDKSRLKTTTQETKSRFTNLARTVAPPLKVNPPKTYVKNTTIRNKPSAIDPEEKRRRNTEASARFRARKKFTEIMLKQQTHDLSCKCCELEKQLAEAKREIYWLKQLLIAKQS
ncbi:hypothetical protein BCR32DRAFT_220040 [Anaeromyces robustus]|uniref:BZIP domain-containing protein n=1 Tax=Anaeromyces robustus TaxID=1754192 RepID=A0A1Y1X7D5_9FUNG|nr:hypothetical protein BCR32DRAFT_220040 [Anaeromyces robustus]|eukprot:ORX81681.1 hypothetical protein BCR32DRAFT_220040 [Anaeromyces robustus]